MIVGLDSYAHEAGMCLTKPYGHHAEPKFCGDPRCEAATLDLAVNTYATTENEWNPRYLLYARAHGKTPEEMLKHDAERFRGGRMLGFMEWMSAQWGVWGDERGLDRNYPKSQREHADFDAWLAARVEKIIAIAVPELTKEAKP
jgi:hypothetical protein